MAEAAASPAGAETRAAAASFLTIVLAGKSCWTPGAEKRLGAGRLATEPGTGTEDVPPIEAYLESRDDVGAAVDSASWSLFRAHDCAFCGEGGCGANKLADNHTLFTFGVVGGVDNSSVMPPAREGCAQAAAAPWSANWGTRPLSRATTGSSLAEAETASGRCGRAAKDAGVSHASALLARREAPTGAAGAVKTGADGTLAREYSTGEACHSVGPRAEASGSRPHEASAFRV